MTTSTTMRPFYATVCALLLAACSPDREHREALLRLDQQNQSGARFTSVDSAKRVAEHYDSRFLAKPNDRMRAYYLLGRAYSDLHESPQAIHYFKEAIHRADTTKDDCDYQLLSKVYVQMALDFYRQYFVREQLAALDKAIYYAWRGGDTVTALTSEGLKINAYQRLNIPDSVISSCERTYSHFLSVGDIHRASIASGQCIRVLVEKGELTKAHQYIQTFETYSNYFDSLGNIMPGMEAYYYTKGLYYLSTGCTDSAEMLFRKEMQEGKDFNNQNASAKGLTALFLKKDMPDSAVKYSLYSYDMNDSIISSRAIEETKRAEALYDYTHAQQMAFNEEKRADRNEDLLWGISICFIIAVFLGYRRWTKLLQKSREQKRQHMQSLKDFDNAQTELMCLQTSKDNLATLIAEKEKAIEEYSNQLKEYKSKESKKKESAEESLQKSPDYLRFQQMSSTGKQMTDDDLFIARTLVVQLFPDFHSFLSAHLHVLNIKMYNTCVLVRLHFSVESISHFLGVSPGYISQIRKEMLKTLFGIDGVPKQFDEIIARYY